MIDNAGAAQRCAIWRRDRRSSIAPPRPTTRAEEAFINPGVVTPPRRSASREQDVPPRAPHAARVALATAGASRVSVYLVSPSSLLRDRGSGEARGVTRDMGRALAQRLGIPVQLVEFRTGAEVPAATKAGTIYFTDTNATGTRDRHGIQRHHAGDRAGLSLARRSLCAAARTSVCASRAIRQAPT